MLAIGDIKIDSLEDISTIPFLGVLDKVLSYEYIREKVNNEIYYFSRSKKFFRAAIIKPNETIDTARFMPCAEFMSSGNRFSPKGVEWLYMGFDRYETYAKKCCFSEVRANEDNNKYCEFTNAFTKDDLVIDLTISDEKNLDDICTFPNRKPYEKYVQIFIIELYMKLVSEEIFKPIDTKDKELEYSPFKLMANYFKKLGYKGIIYKSTVSNCGKNIVVFDKKDKSILDNWIKKKTVKSVGNKYIVVADSIDRGYGEVKFDVNINFNQVHTVGGQDYELYLSKEDIINNIKSEELYGKLKTIFASWRNKGKYSLE